MSMLKFSRYQKFSFVETEKFRNPCHQQKKISLLFGSGNLLSFCDLSFLCRNHFIQRSPGSFPIRVKKQLDLGTQCLSASMQTGKRLRIKLTAQGATKMQAAFDGMKENHTCDIWKKELAASPKKVQVYFPKCLVSSVEKRALKAMTQLVLRQLGKCFSCIV